MIYVATSGYSYPDWIGPVYPEKTARNRMLEYYSSMFPFTYLYNERISAEGAAAHSGQERRII